MRKQKSTLLISTILLVAAACVQPAPDALSPEEAFTEAALDATALLIFASETPVQVGDSEVPTEETSPESTETFAPTSPSLPTATETPILGITRQVISTVTEIPTLESLNSPTPEFFAFNPEQVYGPPQINEQFLSDDSWIGTGGTLPDNGNIRIVVVDREMRVTGKNLLFDTWYFSWPTLDEFFIEMTLDSGQCSGKDSYGLIVRGSASGSPSHGYAVSFSCDGNYRVIRIDSGDPYFATELISWTSSEYIHTGPNQMNRLSVMGEGETFKIYANGQEIGTFIDDWYDLGRYGIFVNSGNTAGYTYRIKQIRVWRYLD